MSKINRAQIFLTLILILAITVSCTTYHVKTPPKGKTGSFFKRNSSELKENSTYDFSKLEKNYGLVIMSYEIEGLSGSNLGGPKAETKTGIRIWEEKFSAKDWDIKQVEKTIKLFEENSYAGTYSSTRKAEVKIEVTFHKGRIVYGGRLVASSLENDLAVEMQFDEDCENFLNMYNNQLADIKIDTALVNLLSKY